MGLYSPVMRTISLLILLTVFTAALLIATASLGIGVQSTLKAPQFSVDPNWPQIPNNWVLGEVTSISVDRNDHIWVLHGGRLEGQSLYSGDRQ